MNHSQRRYKIKVCKIKIEISKLFCCKHTFIHDGFGGKAEKIEGPPLVFTHRNDNFFCPFSNNIKFSFKIHVIRDAGIFLDKEMDESRNENFCAFKDGRHID